MLDPCVSRFVTLSEVKEDNLYQMGSVFYERTEVAFNAEMVIFSKFSNLLERPVSNAASELTLTAEEVAAFLTAYTAYQQELEGAMRGGEG